MSVLSDLQAAEASIASAVAAAVALIKQLQSNPGGTSDADIEAVVSQLNTAAFTLNAAVQPAPPANP